MNTTIPCRCGGEKNQIVGSVSHFIFNKKITIHNVPHYFCSSCENSSYGFNELKVSDMLKDAYLNHTTDVYFTN